MGGIMRLGFVEMVVQDLDASVPFYTEVLGLERTAAVDDGPVYLKCWDEHDHHSVILRHGDGPGVARVGWKVEYDADLDEFEQRIEAYGIPVERLSAGSDPGLGEAISFTAPSGHPMVVYHWMECVGRSILLPQLMPRDLRGIGPPHLDHFFGCAEHIPELLHFMTTVMDFRLTEQILDTGGKPVVVFLARTNTPHDIAFGKGPNGSYHHLAFYLDEWADVRRAAQVLAEKSCPLEVPPSQHGGTRGCTVYFRDPSGNRLETFAGGYKSFADTPTITHTADNASRALFYFGGPASLQAFMEPL